MMTKNFSHEREQLEMLTIDQLVPEDYLVRKLKSAIDFTFIYPLVENFYSGLGRASIDPVVLFKMIFIQYIFGIPTMRQTYEIKEIYAKRKGKAWYAMDNLTRS
jgi:transposase